jgi:hypothetical protein
MYENGKLIHVETILGMGEGEQRKIMEGVNPTMIYCMNFYKYHDVPPVQQ